MLNKDHYDYDEYYRQESRATGEDVQDEKSGIVSKLIILLILLAMAIAAYFGYKVIYKSTVDNYDNILVKVSTNPSIPKSVQNKPHEVKKEVVETKKTTETTKKPKEKEPDNIPKDAAVSKVESSVTTEVTKAMSTQGEMSPKEIATVVAAVMQQMNQNKSTNKSTDSQEIEDNSLFIDELSDSEVDSVSADLIKELKGIDINENKKIDNSKKKIDVYNKVNVEETSGEDTLSQLSKQISSVITEDVNKDKSTIYTKSLKSEVFVRTNEMRIIVVKEGDTLGKIAKRAYGDAAEYKRIYQANPEVTKPNSIYIGQKLRIPN